MRAVLAAVALLAGCAELGGLAADGTSISVGKPNRGYLVDPARIPDDGPGWTTRDVWIARKNRYATDELVDLIEATAKRMAKRVKDVRLVVADLSSRSGGGAFAFHRSHQSGRDADLLYYMRDKDGNPFEPDAMHVFDGRGRAKDGSGITVDVPRTWLLVKDLVTGPEATVQYIFMYEPIAQLLIDHAKQDGEPEWVVTKVRRALRQPGDSARHDDHLHVRVYCAQTDRQFGCEDIGPLDLLAERETEQSQLVAALTSGMMGPRIEVPEPPATPTLTELAQTPGSAPTTDVAQGAGSAQSPAAAAAASSGALGPMANPSASTSGLGSILRARLDRLDFRGWR